jgi:hypothetical protein
MKSVQCPSIILEKRGLRGEGVNKAKNPPSPLQKCRLGTTGLDISSTSFKPFNCMQSKVFLVLMKSWRKKLGPPKKWLEIWNYLFQHTQN